MSILGREARNGAISFEVISTCGMKLDVVRKGVS